MLISARLIRLPRRRRLCAECRRPIDGPTLRLYGSATGRERPSVLYLHPGCTEWQHPKVLAAKGEASSSSGSVNLGPYIDGKQEEVA